MTSMSIRSSGLRIPVQPRTLLSSSFQWVACYPGVRDIRDLAQQVYPNLGYFCKRALLVDYSS